MSDKVILDIQELLSAARTCSATGPAVSRASSPSITALASTYGLPVFTVQGQWLGETERLRLRARFDAALRSWKRDTRYESSLRRTVLHPGYQAIIGMGEAALPFIFEELQKNGGHWLWALHAITQEDPAHEGDSFEAAARAWLRWGQERGYVHPPARTRPRSQVS